MYCLNDSKVEGRHRGFHRAVHRSAGGIPVPPLQHLHQALTECELELSSLDYSVKAYCEVQIRYYVILSNYSHST